MDRLFRISKQHERQLQNMRDEIVKKAEDFLDMLENARKEIPRLIYQSADREVLKKSKLMEWVIEPLTLHQEDVYIMFAHHMDAGQLWVRRSYIKRKNSNHEKIHLSMKYNCIYDIDLFWQDVERYLPPNKRTGDRIRIFRATDDLNETPFWKEIQAQAKENKYIIRNSNKSVDGVLAPSNMKKLFVNDDDIKTYIYGLAKEIAEGTNIRLELKKY
jgi:hypothetical protein